MIRNLHSPWRRTIKRLPQAEKIVRRAEISDLPQGRDCAGKDVKFRDFADRPQAPRWIVFGLVIALHAAVILGLLRAGRVGVAGMQAPPPLALLSVPQARADRVRAGGVSRSSMPEIASRALDAPVPRLPEVAASGAGAVAPGETDGDGREVNWAAEAHRAVEAFEIRRNQPPPRSPSAASPWDGWWPKAHRAGDRFKTANGDWIVWITADCYQIARWHDAPPLGGAQPDTICPHSKAPPRGGDAAN